LALDKPVGGSGAAIDPGKDSKDFQGGPVGLAQLVMVIVVRETLAGQKESSSEN
jgi:hypothetical protein